MDTTTRATINSADRLLCQLHTLLKLNAPRNVITNQVLLIEQRLVEIVDRHGNPDQDEIEGA